MKKFLKIFISMPFMAIALIIYAIAMAVATFIENDYGAPVAKYLVYNSWWFELIQLVLVVNFIGNIFKYKLYKKQKWSILLFHLAFVIILLGAAVTRYIGFEGTMAIREGESTNKFVSEKSYLQLYDVNDENKPLIDEALFVSPYLKNKFSGSFDADGKPFTLVLERIIPNAEKKFVDDASGHPFMEIVFASKFGMNNYYLDDRSELKFQNQIYSLNYSTGDSAVKFTIENGELFVKSPYDLIVVPMQGGKDTTLSSTEKHRVQARQLYSCNDIKFVVKDFSENAKLSYVMGDISKGIKFNVLEFILKSENDKRSIFVPAIVGDKGETVSVKIGKNEFLVSYGAKEVVLPFELKLRDFQLERYPGSNSPSSYASEVTLIDKEKNINEEHRIFMNNILEHRGYRFYQSSYDTDEKGTVLSVNHDKAGTIITYLGYFLLAFGMFWSVFNKNSFFMEMMRKSTDIRKKRLAGILIILISLSSQQLFAQNEGIVSIDADHANKFGFVLTQDNGGRIKPINTVSSEFLRKVSRKEKFEGRNSNQVMLGMTFNPQHWQDVKMIKIAHPEINNILNAEGKYVSFNQLVNMAKGEYKLKTYVDKAFEKKPGERDKFDKELISVDERLNLCYQVYSGQFLKVFPVPGDVHHKWLIPTQLKEIKDSVHRAYAATFFSKYYDALLAAQSSKDWSKADEEVNSLIKFQKTYAKEILPSDSKIKLEIQYVNSNIFDRVYKYYGVFGFILLIVLFVSVLRPKTKVRIPTLITAVILGLLFLYHTYGLVIRWYISGHAPWSNGYESMIYIAWATMLAGFLFMKRSSIALAATSLLASTTLMVAHLSWMDPEITNLVPVLKSYWLTIHVSIITASYGFLALGALMGFLALVLMIFKNKRNVERIELTLSELTNVNHMTLIIGLYMLTIGTFLGGIWANESWGRYWGWDPKETWALISVIVYSFVAHTRFIPSLNNKFAFNFLSLISFSSILMTYFGVNYYLAGLHSYAKGDPVPVPDFVPYTVGIIIAISIIAFIRNKTKITEARKV